MKTRIEPEDRDGQPRMTRMARMQWNFVTELPEPTCRDRARARRVPTQPHKRNDCSIRVIREIRGFAAFLLLACAASALAGVHYVDVNSTNATPPYTNWATAATNIQDAVDAAAAGDEIVVTNGTYAPVTVLKPIAVRSVTGPQFTTINGGGSVRCVYLATNASLSGFTLTNGYVWDVGGGAYGGTLNNCILIGNSAPDIMDGWGGGAAYCTLNNCILTGNSAGAGGGGAAYCTLKNCTLTGNSASASYYSDVYGGGAYSCTLNNCTLSGNSATSGGGAAYSTLKNCTLTGNSGGGALGCTLTNCIAYFNSGANYDSSCALNYSCTTPLPTNGLGNISSDPQLASASHLSAFSPCIGKGYYPAVSGTDIDGEPWANPPSIGCDEYHAGAVTGTLSAAMTASFTNVAVGFAVQLTAFTQGRTAATSWDFGDGNAATNQAYISHAWAAPGDYTVTLRAYNEDHQGGISATLAVHVVNEVHYVAAGSLNPVAPYMSWATAATNIQDAVDTATVPGALVLVTNGTYARVLVRAFTTARSVNGPLFTTIIGGHSNLCASLASNASLSGFTLTEGAAGAYGGTLSNCTLIGNFGGGAYYCTLNNCTLSGNSAQFGGGGYGCTLNNCTLTGNSCSGSGGGAAFCTLNNCTLTGNSAEGYGGGALLCTLNNCTLSGNSAYYGSGGGADNCTLNNCALTGNSAYYGSGGGASGCTLNNCTLTGNSGGGAHGCTLNNCTSYFNTGANYDPSCTLSYCCTTPLPNGVGNISADPQMASASHLSAGSPCRGAGNAAYASGTDIDGEAWLSPPSIGCDEYHAGAVTGPLRVDITTSLTNVATDFPVEFRALIEGRTTASVWDFGDGTTVTNQPYTSHAWAAPGDYAVVLRAYNESEPGGISAIVTIHVMYAVHYVAADSANPVAPYTTWATAATNIQAAVSAATVPGALVLVTNGAYAPIQAYGPLTVRSVNGPLVTVINGGHSNWCVYLATVASLSGFTLTNGVGGAYGGTLSNCTLIGNFGGGARNCTLTNCVLSGNSSSYYGGGADQCALNNCTLTGNSAVWGGGAHDCTLNSCTLTGNSATGGGGGAYDCTLNNCTLTANSGGDVGGAYNSTLNNCTLTGNKGTGASYSTLNNCTLTGNSGDGASGCTLNNCALTGNSGGGASSCTLNNCTLTGNSGDGAYGCTLNNCTVAGNSGGGASYSTLNNCIAYFNGGGNYGPSSTLNYCCTTPLPASGVGNISADPQLASASHLSAGSPCRGAGNTAYARGTDIDGEAWLNPPSIGCDEYHAGAVTGPLKVAVAASFTNVAIGFTVQLTGLIDGRAAASVWNFGDGITATDEPYTSHGWAVPGDYLVVLRAYNDSQPGGVSASVTIHVVAQPVHYVAADSANPVPPYTSWATAARSIQDAVDAATVPGALVLVTNGTYSTGGRTLDGYTTNRVVVDKLLTVRSVNGPRFTAIDGGGSVRCVYLTNSAILSGLTLTNGYAYYGGGLFCDSTNAVVLNCVLSGNSGGGAYGSTLNNCTLSGNSGGGAHSSTLNNCVLSGNSSSYYGGGADQCALNNCTLTGNSAYGSGGVLDSTVNNCIVYFNTAQQGANYDSSSTLNYCCTTPLPTNGVGNISADPQLASASHLSAGSPCRGAGNAAYASGTDIDGEAWANPPSIGCDEYRVGAVTGPLNVDITASFTNVAPGFTVQFTALIEGRTTGSMWDFGEGITATNQPYPSHAWTAPGNYPVVLRAYNESQPGGISATVTIHVVNEVHYVAANSSSPMAPYSSWATAARSIQDAVDAATVPGALVLVTNGTYVTGSRNFDGYTTNRVTIGKLLVVRSVNGPRFTVIDGANSVRCAYLTNGATLSGFTLTHGLARYGRDTYASAGAGVFCQSPAAVVSNCVVAGNSAFGGTVQGGGASGGTLLNCALSGNSVVGQSYEAYSSYGIGGGAYDCALNNCTLTGNSASGYTGGSGGGAYGCTLNNCSLSGNSASGYYGSGGGAEFCTLDNCTLTGNSASGGYYYGVGVGGGAHDCTLNNCTLTGNWATGPYNGAGGAYYCALNNCILYSNVGQNYDSYSTLNHCCTTPAPGGIGNITDAPRFLDTNAWANLRLQSNSPCINAGLNALAPAGPDLDDNPRIVGGTVDIGAYEFQNPSSRISYAWLEKYGLATDGSADYADTDGDGVNNWQEWVDGSNPTDPLSSRPVIQTQPASQRVTLGDNATFSVTATGTVPMAYQWRFNATDDIPDATDLVLVVSNLQWASGGSYAVLLSNVYGSLLSSNAILTLNQAPVADASASRLLYISSNGTNVTVILDGSRSSDPDNDPLSYLWLSTLNSQPSTLLASGVVAVIALPVGTHSVALAVNDGLAARTNAITLEVLTTAQAVQRLAATVLSSVSRPQPLLATLDAALASINRGNSVSSINQLLAFQNKVRAQVAPLGPSLAASLISSAQDIIDTLSGGNTNPAGRPHGQFTSLARQSNGAMRMQFTAAAGTYLMEASTNLVDWEVIGVAAPRADGGFEFEDTQAARSSSRFYRVGVSNP